MHYAQKALAITPNWVMALFWAGRCHWTNDPDKAEELLLRALETDSTFLPIYYELSSFYRYQSKPERYTFYNRKYIEKAEYLLANNPEEATIFYQTLLGAELWRAGRLTDAAAVLEKVTALTKNRNLFAQQYLGAVYHDLGQFDKFIENAKIIIELSPFSKEGYNQLASAYQSLKLPLKEIEVYEKALLYIEKAGVENCPSLIQFLPMLGDAYQKMGREADAKLLYRKMLRLIPDFSDAFQVYCVARSWLGLGDLEAMQRTIDEGFKKFPDNFEVYYQTACLWSLAKDEKKALEWLEIAIKKGFDTYGWIASDTDLDNIRESEGFKGLMKKYFPEQFDD